MGYIIMLIGILFYVYAIVGVFVFGKTDPMHFGDLHHAFVTPFKVLTLEGCTDIINAHVFDNVEHENRQILSLLSFFYFASFILVGDMIIMNQFIGVIMNSMEESLKEFNKAAKEKYTYSERGDYDLDRTDVSISQSMFPCSH